MLDLDSTRWAELRHAYGPATDMPPLLRRLAQYPRAESADSEPYHSLWSALCHQGDVYSASYAAVPHIVHALAADPLRAPADCFHLPTAIEIARLSGRGPEVPPDLLAAYQAALDQLPDLVSRAAARRLDEGYCRVLAAALATAKGQYRLGEAILELEPVVVSEFMAWVIER